jgi:hypothetical protein
MKKYFPFLIAIALLAFAVSPAAAWHDGYATVVITGGVVTDNTLSTAATIPRGVESVSIYVPTITSATVSLKVSHDGGTTYDDLFCLNNNTNTVLWSSAAGTGGMYLQAPIDCGIGFYNKLKVLTGSAQAADRSFVVIFKKYQTKSNQ